MSRIASQAGASDRLREIYAPVESELAEVERILRAELRSDYPYVDELVRYGCLLGGKRLRPALLLLAGRAVGRLTRDHLVLAAVVEMIHTATLVHDDVLDEADTRRHLATVNSRWDNKASVLLGDYLFTHAFYLASTLDSTWACQVIGRATNTVCEGELRQKGSRGDYSLSEKEYLEIIADKTAALCACACRLGAQHAGAAEPSVQRLARFGQFLGVSFQIIDDLLDLLGDEQATGKSLGTDLLQQKPTLPVIRLLQRADAAEHAEVLALLDRPAEQALEPLQARLKATGALDYALDTARRYARQAARELAPLDDNAAVRTLSMMTDFVVQRTR